MQYIYSLFFRFFSPYRSLQSIQQSSLCCTVGPYQLCIYNYIYSIHIYIYIYTYIYNCFIYSSVYVGESNGTPLQYSCLENPMDRGAWWAAVHGVTKSRTRLSDFTFTFHFHALEKAMATHSSVLAWRILGTGEPGRLPSMGSHRVGHD